MGGWMKNNRSISKQKKPFGVKATEIKYMSWSLTLIGKTGNIVKALEEQSTKFEGGTKLEFDAALPHLIGLVKENWNNGVEPVMKLSASGHGYDTLPSVRG